MIIKYFRDKNKTPYGVIVAINRDQLGWAFCSSKDHFEKKVGVDLAVSRAEKVRVPFYDFKQWNDGKGVDNITAQLVLQACAVPQTKSKEVFNYLPTFLERSRRYFKESV
jgi:hypothetical protein